MAVIKMKNHIRKGTRTAVDIIRATQDEVVNKILTVLIFLCSFGLIMILSASGSMEYFGRQLLFIALGAAVGFGMYSVVPMRLIYKLSKYVYLFAILLILALLTPMARGANGATRWLRFPGFQLQVCEVVKIAVVLLMGYLIYRYPAYKKSWKFTAILWAVGGVPSIMLVIISNDLSSAMVVLMMTFVITLIFQQTPKLHLIAVGAVVLVVVGAIIYTEFFANLDAEDVSFRILRIAGWLHPERYSQSTAFQTTQSLYAIGRGGLFGKGLGTSIQKWGSLPEAHTDFIASIIFEELGMAGAGLLFLLYIYLLILIVKVCRKTTNTYHSVLCVGIMSQIAVQVLINIGVCTAVLPNTGLTLPFISYGGTSVALLIIEVIGIVLKIEKINH